MQPLNPGVMPFNVEPRPFKAVGTSPPSLFAKISGTALAKTIELAARTVKMVEKRMVKRVVKRVRRLLGLEVIGVVGERLVWNSAQLL